ncbi:sensor histidine kinase [Polymorphospora rubra]|uniref:histidine kinase n=1 Tax=Polymorphospora rubra TaxID=338584 RepID=A0A810MZG2_9ACTN|nr:histidine kinase [Polymorphospora rubra]BCJ64953.1 two-component sensor histidine kinase [Polymorphospora rubra]
MEIRLWAPVRPAEPLNPWSWLVAGALAVVLMAVNIPVATEVYEVPLAVAFAAGIAQAVALPLTLRWPVEATAVQFAGVIAFAVTLSLDAGPTWPLTIPGLLALIAHVTLVGLFHEWRVAATAWWASVLLCFLLVVLDLRAGHTVAEAEPLLVIYATNSALITLGAIAFRQRAVIRRQLVDARRDVALEQAQRAVVEERTRIARELHDVVAHSMSVIHMQATSAAYRIKNIDDESRAEFGQIAAGARGALREMRQLLAVLRDEDAAVDLRPVPGLDRLDELAESVRRGGVPVELRIGDEVRRTAVPDAVALAAYRIVQESLSNVIRHAAGAPTVVGVDVEPGDVLAVVVTNAPAAGPVGPPEEVGRAGHGLHGMRERVRLVGGTLETGPLAGGGYGVLARLPIRWDEAADGSNG